MGAREEHRRVAVAVAVAALAAMRATTVLSLFDTYLLLTLMAE